MAVEVEDLESEIGQLVVSTSAQRLGEPVGIAGFTEQPGAVVAVAAYELEVAAGDGRDEAVPVVLDLMQPAIAVRRHGAGRTIWRWTVRGVSAGTASGGQGEARRWGDAGKCG